MKELCSIFLIVEVTESSYQFFYHLFILLYKLLLTFFADIHYLLPSYMQDNFAVEKKNLTITASQMKGNFIT